MRESTLSTYLLILAIICSNYPSTVSRYFLEGGVTVWCQNTPRKILLRRWPKKEGARDYIKHIPLPMPLLKPIYLGSVPFLKLVTDQYYVKTLRNMAARWQKFYHGISNIHDFDFNAVTTLFLYKIIVTLICVTRNMTRLKSSLFSPGPGFIGYRCLTVCFKDNGYSRSLIPS